MAGSSVASGRGVLSDALVARHFDVEGGVLRIGGVRVDTLVEAHGSPLYVYCAQVLRQRFGALREALQGFADVFYSIKANPNPAVAAVLVREGAGLEVASGAEFLLARAAGARARDILFAGPGKGAAELELAVSEGIGEIHLESFDEIERLAAIATRLGRDVDVAIRVNPVAAAAGGAMRMGGKPAAFGFDEETIGEVVAAIGTHPRLRLTGVHLFAGTQILDARVLLAQWAHGLAVAAAVGERLGRPIETVDLGGGLGIPYHAGDGELDLGVLADGIGALARVRAASRWTSSARVLIEPGRYLAGPAGVYLATVVAVKSSRGQRFVVADGGMHHHLAASGNLGQVIKRDYPIVAASRADDPRRSDATLVGPLCTPLDTLGRQTPLPELRVGEIVAVLQSGAYGLSASPVGFLGHPSPAEVLVDAGTHRRVRERGSFERPVVSLGA